MELERDDYVKLVQRDVNNYIMVDKDGHVKGRGPDCKAPSVLDADLPIIRHAIRDYLAFGIPVEKTINDCEYLMRARKFLSVKANTLKCYTMGSIMMKQHYKCIR